MVLKINLSYKFYQAKLEAIDMHEKECKKYTSQNSHLSLIELANKGF